MSIQKVKAGYLCRWRENGEHRGRTFDRRRDAAQFEAEVRRRRQLGTLATLTGTAPTLSDYVRDTWGPQHAAHLAARSRALYAAVMGKHLLPALGDARLSEITTGMVRQWQQERLLAGSGPSTVARALRLLAQILDHAMEGELIASNPARVVKPPKRPRPAAVRPLAPATVERLRAQLSPNSSYVVSVLAYAGLRPSECLALTWEDVRQETILVAKGLEPDGSVKATKTDRHRAVRLLDELRRDLAEWRMQSGRPADRALVFPRSDGKAWTKQDWTTWSRQQWKPACTAVGLEPVPRPYDLRHGFASLLAAEGRSPHYIAKQLGHSVAMSLATYQHLFDEYEDCERIDANAEIRKARNPERALDVHTAAV